MPPYLFIIKELNYFLVNSKLSATYKIKAQQLSIKNLQYLFEHCCEYGYFNNIKFLLTKTQLLSNIDYLFFHKCFQIACENEHLNIIKFLVTSKRLTKNINLQQCYSILFKLIKKSKTPNCILKYLFSLKKQLDLESIFILLLRKKDIDLSYYYYFIFHLKIKKTMKINYFLMLYPNSIVESLFTKRILNKKLNQSLTINIKTSCVNKI